MKTLFTLFLITMMVSCMNNEPKTELENGLIEGQLQDSLINDSFKVPVLKLKADSLKKDSVKK